MKNLLLMIGVVMLFGCADSEKRIKAKCEKAIKEFVQTKARARFPEYKVTSLGVQWVRQLNDDESAFLYWDYLRDSIAYERSFGFLIDDYQLADAEAKMRAQENIARSILVDSTRKNNFSYYLVYAGICQNLPIENCDSLCVALSADFKVIPDHFMASYIGSLYGYDESPLFWSIPNPGDIEDTREFFDIITGKTNGAESSNDGAFSVDDYPSYEDVGDSYHYEIEPNSAAIQALAGFIWGKEGGDSIFIYFDAESEYDLFLSRGAMNFSMPPEQRESLYFGLYRAFDDGTGYLTARMKALEPMETIASFQFLSDTEIAILSDDPEIKGIYSRLSTGD